jgi:hypothetical protein
MAAPNVPIPFWAKIKSREPSYPNPMVPTITSTGEQTMGDMSVLNTHNNDRASRIPDRGPEKTAFHRSAMGMGEALGARLSISPSGKIPQTDKQSTMASSLRTVKSGRGRNKGGFKAGEGD